MYQNIFIQDRYSPDARVYLWDDEDGLTTFPYESYCYVIDPSGRYRTLYGQPASRRRYVRRSEKEALREEYGTHDVTFESDVRPETRVLVDRYTGDSTPSTGHRRMYFDIEVSMEPELPDPDTAENTVTSVALWDSEREQQIVLLLDDSMDDFSAGDAEVRTFDSEPALLRRFLAEWHEVRPTLVIGYNSDRFDIPYIYRRLRRVLGQERADSLSEIGVVRHNERSNTFTIAGCASLDYLRLYKVFTFSELSSYSLDNVAKEELDRGKIAYEGRRYVSDGDGYRPAPDDASKDDVRVVRDLDDLRAYDPALFAEYNMIDVMLLVGMDEKLEFIDLARTICHLGRVPYEDIYMSSRYIDGAILARLKQNGVVAPDRRNYDLTLDAPSPAGADQLTMTRDIPEYIPYKGTLRIWKTESSNTEVEYSSREGDRFNLAGGLPHDVTEDMRVTLHYEGGYVKPPDTGLHEWIYDLDLTSMYPSIMMSLNISPETKVGRVFNWDPERAASGDHPDEYEVWLHDGNRRLRVPADQMISLLREKELCIAANGVFYRNDRRGVIPDILEEWFASRNHYKSLRDEQRHSDEEGSDAEAEYYDKQQHVRKILINSVYGVSGLPTFRYYDVDNAEAITLTGQTLIKFSEAMGNRYYNDRVEGEDKDWCKYVDTDSVFFPARPIVDAERPDVNTEDEQQMTDAILGITDDVQAYINGTYDVFADAWCAIPDVHKFELTGKSHHFDIKQELVARSALWVSKKRYAQWIINDEGEPATDLEDTRWNTSQDGVPAGEHDVKGLDIVRSDFPECFRDHLEHVTFGILHFEDREALDRSILDFKASVHERPLEDIANPTGVNKMEKYDTDRVGARKKYTPVHVSSAMAYNELLEIYGLDGDVQPMRSGDKIRWVYLDQNSLGVEKIAFKGYGEDPERVMEFIRNNVSHQVMYEKGLERKIEKVYGAMGWSLPSQAARTLNTFL